MSLTTSPHQCLFHPSTPKRSPSLFRVSPLPHDHSQQLYYLKLYIPLRFIFFSLTFISTSKVIPTSPQRHPQYLIVRPSCPPALVSYPTDLTTKSFVSSMFITVTPSTLIPSPTDFTSSPSSGSYTIPVLKPTTYACDYHPELHLSFCHTHTAPVSTLTYVV